MMFLTPASFSKIARLNSNEYNHNGHACFLYIIRQNTLMGRERATQLPFNEIRQLKSKALHQNPLRRKAIISLELLWELKWLAY